MWQVDDAELDGTGLHFKKGDVLVLTDWIESKPYWTGFLEHAPARDVAGALVLKRLPAYRVLLETDAFMPRGAPSTLKDLFENLFSPHPSRLCQATA